MEELISEIKKINKNTRIIFTSNKSYNEDNLFNILKNNIEKENNKINKKIKPEIKEKISKKYNYKNKINNYNNFLENNN